VTWKPSANFSWPWVPAMLSAIRREPG
jgi:hypothetical protein